jgi:hypothetical protein
MMLCGFLFNDAISQAQLQIVNRPNDIIGTGKTGLKNTLQP